MINSIIYIFSRFRTILLVQHCDVQKCVRKHKTLYKSSYLKSILQY